MPSASPAIALAILNLLHSIPYSSNPSVRSNFEKKENGLGLAKEDILRYPSALAICTSVGQTAQERVESAPPRVYGCGPGVD